MSVLRLHLLLSKPSLVLIQRTLLGQGMHAEFAGGMGEEQRLETHLLVYPLGGAGGGIGMRDGTVITQPDTWKFP